MSFITINYENYNNNFMFYKSSFSNFITSLKFLITFTSSSSDSLAMFIINSINVILFDIADLTVNLSRNSIIEIKEIDVILSEKSSSNKRVYVKNVKEFGFFSRK